MRGPELNLTARDFESIELHADSRADRLIVHDSIGNDWFVAGNREIRMTGAGHTNWATGFTTIHVQASTGHDRIDLIGSDGDDRFVSDVRRQVLRNEAGRVVVSDFERVAVSVGAGMILPICLIPPGMIGSN